MPKIQYFIVQRDAKWFISLNGEHYGPYASEAAAKKIAINAAQESGADGREAEVLIQDENKKFRAKWTYGEDPYCPEE